jgi:hypothetical protein
MARVTERTVLVNGIDLHLAEAGPAGGPPMLLHGFPDSWRLGATRSPWPARACGCSPPDQLNRLLLAFLGIA